MGHTYAKKSKMKDHSVHKTRAETDGTERRTDGHDRLCCQVFYSTDYNDGVAKTLL